MVRYLLAAMFLKFFSISPQTKHLYRNLGNTYGKRIRLRVGLPAYKINRAKQLLHLCKRYKALQDGSLILEIGTGWAHWDSMVLRLFYDLRACLFDVWDNRQFEAIKLYVKQFNQIVDQELGLECTQNAHIHTLLESILTTKSFDDLYDLLGFEYVLDPNGNLDQFGNETFHLIITNGVLEHINRAKLPHLIREFYRLLKPGGYSIHHIVIADHLAFYDPTVSKKHYLKYSDKVWKRYFENDVQHFNRLQRPEWMHLFNSSGLELVEESLSIADIGQIKTDKQYTKLSKTDLECTVLELIHRKPL